MDSTASGIDFAAIGHQDNWQKIYSFVNGIRENTAEALPMEKLKDIFPFIPSRDIFKVKVKSKTGALINGVYIDTFIDPDKLDARFAKSNIQKIVQAADCAGKLKASIAALGGFTSIILEGKFDYFPENGTQFTTGNTLTASLIVKGIEKAILKLQIDLPKANLLIIGATGDIGLACVQYFKRKSGKIFLCARNAVRLEKLAHELREEDIQVESSTQIAQLLQEADIIVSAASSSGIITGSCRKPRLICDAGYPKNFAVTQDNTDSVSLFHGGMGIVTGGIEFFPDYSKLIYQYPVPNIAHGCLLEAAILAFEKRAEPYSAGKGKITIEKMEEIYGLAEKHGIEIAPFFNNRGLWQND